MNSWVSCEQVMKLLVPHPQPRPAPGTCSCETGGHCLDSLTYSSSTLCESFCQLLCCYYFPETVVHLFIFVVVLGVFAEISLQYIFFFCLNPKFNSFTILAIVFFHSYHPAVSLFLFPLEICTNFIYVFYFMFLFQRLGICNLFLINQSSPLKVLPNILTYAFFL